MKVGDRKQVLSTGPGGVASPVDPATSNGPLLAPAPSEDQVRVSQVARALARLIAHGDDAELAVRPDKVEPLKAAVARGEYRVDLQATARKFLREVIGDLAR
jgi:flagellar biosynthesis anti-sigma factor FlgM